MNKINSEIKYFRKEINYMTKYSKVERLTIECRKYKIPSAYAVEILKYIFPEIKQTSFIPIEVDNWIRDEYLIDKKLRHKNLEKFQNLNFKNIKNIE